MNELWRDVQRLLLELLRLLRQRGKRVVNAEGGRTWLEALHGRALQ